MKKTDLKSIPSAAALACGLIASMTTAACDRPTYWVTLRDLSSTCDGNVNLRLWHDPDPDEAVIRLADKSVEHPDAYKIAELKDESPYIKVVFRSGVTCRFLANEPEGDCRMSSMSEQRAACTAELKMVKLLKPTHKGGFDGESPPLVPAE